MDTIHNVSDRLIDWGVRLENVADAAEGKAGGRRGPRMRWLLLPAAGAGLYALTTNGAFSRQAKDVMDQARTRASELPDDLMGRLRQTTQEASETTRKATDSGQQRRQQSKSRHRKAATRRKAAPSSR